MPHEDGACVQHTTPHAARRCWLICGQGLSTYPVDAVLRSCFAPPHFLSETTDTVFASRGQGISFSTHGWECKHSSLAGVALGIAGSGGDLQDGCALCSQCCARYAPARSAQGTGEERRQKEGSRAKYSPGHLQEESGQITSMISAGCHERVHAVVMNEVSALQPNLDAGSPMGWKLYQWSHARVRHLCACRTRRRAMRLLCRGEHCLQERVLRAGMAQRSSLRAEYHFSHQDTIDIKNLS